MIWKKFGDSFIHITVGSCQFHNTFPFEEVYVWAFFLVPTNTVLYFNTHFFPRRAWKEPLIIRSQYLQITVKGVSTSTNEKRQRANHSAHWSFPQDIVDIPNQFFLVLKFMV